MTPAPGRTIACLAIVFALLSCLAVVALRCVEVEAEFDAYHVAAEHLLQGDIVFDRFHPLGYPLLVAPVLWLVGNGLIAAPWCRRSRPA